jgi:hypothetical protein
MTVQAEAIRRLNTIVPLVREVYKTKPMMNQADLKVVRLLQEFETALILSKDRHLTLLSNMVWNLSQIYKDRVLVDLSPEEQRLVETLQAQGFLTSDPSDDEYAELTVEPGGEQAAITSFTIDVLLPDDDAQTEADRRVAEAQAQADRRVAQMLAGADWHSLTPKMVTEAIVLRHGKGLLGSPYRRYGDNDGYHRCTVGRVLGGTQ